MIVSVSLPVVSRFLTSSPSASREASSTPTIRKFCTPSSPAADGSRRTPWGMTVRVTSETRSLE